MANFTVRFFYEFFFEICLSILIHITALNDGSSMWLYSLSMLLALAILAFIVSLILLFFRHGPYSVPKSYAWNSLRDSWWGARHLDPNQIEPVEANSPQNYDGETGRALLTMAQTKPVEMRDEGNLQINFDKMEGGEAIAS